MENNFIYLDNASTTPLSENVLNIINFPVFNIADISINIGFIFLLYNIFKNNR